MRNILLLFISLIVFSIALLIGLLQTTSESLRPPFYYYPNGTIIQSDENFPGVLGKKVDLLELEIAVKLAESGQSYENGIHVYDKGVSETIPVILTPKSPYSVLADFTRDILISLLYLSVAIWFFFYTRDLYMVLLFGSLSCLSLFNFFLVGFHDFHFLFFFFLYFTAFVILNITFRLRGKELPTRWFAPEIIFSLIAGFVGKSQKADPQIFGILATNGVYFILFCSLICILFLIADSIRNLFPLQSLFKKLSLIAAFSVISIIPFVSVEFSEVISPAVSKLLIVSAFVIFPALIIYGTFMYSIVPVQIAFSSSLTSIYLILILAGGYLFLLSVFFKFNPAAADKYLQEFNLLFISISVYTLGSVNRRLSNLVDTWSFKRNQRLHSALETVSSMISAPISMRATINSLMRMVSESLEITKILVLIPADKFPRTDLKNINFIRISSTSEIWQYFASNTEVTVTTHLAYGLGIRESVYKFLQGSGIQLAYPIFNYSRGKEVLGVFLVGEKKNRKNFNLGELHFLKECTRMASMLLQNYALLAEEVEKKRIVRDLNMASIIDKTLHVAEGGTIKGIKIGFFSIPAVGISGDYLDLQKLSSNRMMLALGDVSGHGLGTGYLVSAIRGIIQNQIRKKSDLSSIFKVINSFLIERYRGSEFMTFICGEYNSSEETFRYINAGHSSPICIRKNGKIELRTETQRVLGVLPTEYKHLTIPIYAGDKLILFTDGVTETFNDNDEIFGDEKFIQILAEHHQLDPQDLADLVLKTIQNFRGKKDPSDDISFICLQVNE
ncbi:serine/threonine protein phosphatase [Leptospira gomenensis]|uniref:Serine/threonine protein phosphatase n=1 Tax=Leptospira gomenensis TaxID=2484974 RepID=A0A5F1YPP7_9LEPT|nr:PP2C family protein-serine/threonine phosphatase [Leptospira gomenensis]TGK28176.1 serine/threonine protein phosphatase [Leptospira gomenensis]TGK36970.1 serine/threonine protein phosphatase [Leptospira gomenensis]TGK45607.1 serine/threonine protein phosphatase [Leptospira gomenensis]TGK59546.1 serine/threonine protein phosphatase [Leptospira gomenensis]